MQYKTTINNYYSDDDHHGDDYKGNVDADKKYSHSTMSTNMMGSGHFHS